MELHYRHHHHHYVLIFYLFALLILCVSLTTANTNSSSLPTLSESSSILCPSLCVCSNDSKKTVTCKTDDTTTSHHQWIDTDTCKELDKLATYSGEFLHLKLELSIQHNSSQSHRHQDLDFQFQCLSVLESLDLSFLELTVIPSSFDDSLEIETKNVISSKTLNRLTHLNLTNNNISKLELKSFSNLNSLQVLDVSFNEIESIDSGTFMDLKNLTFLDLSHNKLTHFSTFDLPLSANLKYLLLLNNNLKSLYIGKNSSLSQSINNLKSIDVSNNPLECSCLLQDALKLVSSSGIAIDNSRNTVCHYPVSGKNLSIIHLNDTALKCSAPHSVVSFPSEKKSVLYSSKIKLECRAESYPKPNILWITPWGEKFSIAPSFLMVHQNLADEGEVSVESEYKDHINLMTSYVKVTQSNDLIVSNFRGSLSGNYSCIAFNEVGSKSETIRLNIHASLKSAYGTSLIFACYCASCCLMIGVLIGCINSLIQKLIRKGFNIPLFTPAASVKPACSEHPTSISGGGPCSIYSDLSPPMSPLLETISEKSLYMDTHENTYDNTHDNEISYSSDGTDSPTKRGGGGNHHLRDTLGGARDKLRDGVGKKMDSVRKNVQSIKESTGAYMHTIMESGSSAANKMKAGVAMGVETVKYQLQSVKELCGTGNMGSHTVSIISVETDIDTDERKKIVRQVTFV